MPYVYDPNREDEDQQGIDPSTAPSLADGSSSSADGVPGGAQATTSSPTSSGSYQNLNNYLDANKGSGFGDQFVGKVNQDVSNANTAQQESASQFKGASDAGTVKYKEDLAKFAADDPYSFSQDQNNVTAYQNMINGQYQGPKSYTDSQDAYQKAYGATKKSQDVTNYAQSEPGRFALLDNYFGNTNYNQGQKSLDNLLIQGDQNTGAALQQSKRNSDQSRLNFENQANELQKYAAGNLATSTENAAKAKSNITGAQGSTKDQINQAYQNALNQYGTNVLGAKQKLSSLNVGNDLLSKYGLTGGSQTYGVDPSEYLNTGMAPTLQNVTDPNLAKKYDAYSKILGESNDFLDAGSVTGGFQENPSFDKAGFDSRVATQRGSYQNAIAQAMREFAAQPFFADTKMWNEGLYNAGKGPLGQQRGKGIDPYVNAANGAQQDELFNQIYGGAHNMGSVWGKGNDRAVLLKPSEQAYVDKVNQLRNQYGYSKKLS